MLNLSAPDLTVHPPRSPRARLGGYVQLPRIIDKARALSTGSLGEYQFPSPLDRHFYTFTGLSPEELLEAVREGHADAALLAWVREAAPLRRLPIEITAWSTWLENHSPGDAEDHAWFAETLARLAPTRDDIRTYFDLLELDDFVSFGGRG